MRTFDEVRRDLNLEKGVGSANGDLYVVPVAPGAPRLLVRHFNRDLPSRLVPAYASLLREAQAWIDRDPELARVLRVGVTTLFQLQKRPDFPAPIWLGPRLKRHQRARVMAWAEKLREKPAEVPA